MKAYSCNLKLKVSVGLYVICTVIAIFYLLSTHDWHGCLFDFLLLVLFALTLKYLIQIKDVDVFTGVYKKTKLMKDLEQSKERGKRFSLCLVDFNGLKRINDEYGHVVGDKLILAFSDALKKLFKNDKEVVLYRYTCGDEFCIVSYTDNVKKIIDFNRKIETISSLEVPIELLDGRTFSLSLTVSYGFSNFDGTKPVLNVIDEADRSMYEYKKAFKEQH